MLHGDRVMVRISGTDAPPGRPEGKLVEVLERANPASSVASSTSTA